MLELCPHPGALNRHDAENWDFHKKLQVVDVMLSNQWLLSIKYTRFGEENTTFAQNQGNKFSKKQGWRRK